LKKKGSKTQMHFEEIILALEELSAVRFRLLERGHWVLEHESVKKSNGTFAEVAENHGITVQGAVTRYWAWLTRNDGTWIVAPRGFFVWGGHTWLEVRPAIYEQPAHRMAS
jgi:hypothetical protein